MCHRSSAALLTGTVFVPTELNHWLKLRMVPVSVGVGGGCVVGNDGVNVSVLMMVSPFASVVVNWNVVWPVCVGAGWPTGPCWTGGGRYGCRWCCCCRRL